MSGECDKCGEHALECTCESLSRRQENDLKPLVDCENPLAELPPVKWINVNGREEHEALLKDSQKCTELGLDQVYETIVYLKRWGGWLNETS